MRASGKAVLGIALLILLGVTTGSVGARSGGERAVAGERGSPPGRVDEHKPAVPLPTVSTMSTMSTVRDGCEPSNLGALQDDGFVKPSDRRGGGMDRPLGTAGPVVSGESALSMLPFIAVLPPYGIGGRSRQLTMYEPQTATLSVAYARKVVLPTDSTFDFLATGGFGLTERPFAGQDAELVFNTLTRNRWLVTIGDQQATLVWADPYTDTLRPFGLYWSDGIREYILIGAPTSPDELVDFARALACQE